MLEDFNYLKKDIQEYLEVRMDLIKLNMAENISRIVSNATSIAIIGFLLFFILLFLSFAAGFYMANTFNSNVIGFLSVAFFYFVLLLIFFLFRKQIIERPIIKAIVSLFFSNRTKDEK